MTDKITLNIKTHSILCSVCDKPKKIKNFQFTSNEDFCYILLECGHGIPVWSDWYDD